MVTVCPGSSGLTLRTAVGRRRPRGRRHDQIPVQPPRSGPSGQPDPARGARRRPGAPRDRVRVHGVRHDAVPHRHRGAERRLVLRHRHPGPSGRAVPPPHARGFKQQNQ